MTFKACCNDSGQPVRSMICIQATAVAGRIKTEFHHLFVASGESRNCEKPGKIDARQIVDEAVEVINIQRLWHFSCCVLAAGRANHLNPPQ